jgi:hypothetical protein
MRPNWRDERNRSWSAPWWRELQLAAERFSLGLLNDFLQGIAGKLNLAPPTPA